MPELPRRGTPRLATHDYSTPGAYFVTVCADRRKLLFSRNATTSLIYEAWESLPQRYDGAVDGDAFVVMPNHIHGIIWINPGERRVVLSTIVGAFKAGVTYELRRKGFVRGTVWQSGFHEHIIRNERALDAIRLYIANNPSRWDDDPYHPAGASDAVEAFWTEVQQGRMERGGLRRKPDPS